MFGGGGADVESGGRGAWAGPREKGGDWKGPARRVASVLAGDGLGMPAAPCADGGERGAGGGEGGGTHAAEAVPSERGPGGVCKQGVESLLEVLLGGGKGASGLGGCGGKGRETRGPSGSPGAQGRIDPSAANLLVKEGKGGGLEVIGADAGGLADAEELGKGEEGKAGGAGLGGRMGLVGEEEEEVGGGPQLWWGRCGDRLQRSSHGPMEWRDSCGEEAQGFKLPDRGE